MNSDEVEHLHELLKIHKKRLNVLEQQAAKYGINCPPEIKIEIEEIREQVARFERHLQGNVIQSYLQGRETLKQFNREMDSITHGLSKIVIEERRTYRFFGLPVWSVVISRTILTLLMMAAVVGVGFVVQEQERATNAAETAAAQATATVAQQTAKAQATAQATAQTAQAAAETAQAAAGTAQAAQGATDDASDIATDEAIDSLTATAEIATQTAQAVPTPTPSPEETQPSPPLPTPTPTS